MGWVTGEGKWDNIFIRILRAVYVRAPGYHVHTVPPALAASQSVSTV